MTDAQEMTVMNNAIKRYGATHQKMKCLEEMAELTKEIVKDIICEGKREHIVEEYSDLVITLNEIAEIYDITAKEVNEWKNRKLSRLAYRMEHEVIEECDNSAHVDMAYEK